MKGSGGHADRTVLGDLAAGAGAGGVATVAMSAVMWGAQKLGLMGQQPPERITEAAMSRAGADAPSGRGKDAAAAALHLAFGGIAGAGFALARRVLPPAVPAEIAGAVYGLGVWAGSYAGWIPALRILPEPSHDRPGRPASMIAAHLAYGATLGRVLG